MYCILAFDSLNDIIYKKYDEICLHHLKQLGRQQGLISQRLDDDSDDVLSSNVIMQLFSPIVTSQRVMATQFGNSYTNIQCQNGTKLVFDECMGYLFAYIGLDDVSTMKRILGTCISFVRHICGPDVEELKHNPACNALLGQVLDKWHELRMRDQAFFVEALEQLAVNGEITTAALSSLKDACSSLKSSLSYGRSHGLLLVQEKLLALYTSRETDDLIPSDLVFLDILANIQHVPSETEMKELNKTGKVKPTLDSNPTCPESGGEVGQHFKPSIKSYTVFLKGKKSYRPHAVQVVNISQGIFFLLIYQTGSESLCIGLYDAFITLTNFQKVIGTETDADLEKKAFESLDTAFKKISDSLKKNKNSLKAVECTAKLLMSKWDVLRKKFVEYSKSGEQYGGGFGIPGTATGLMTTLRDLFQTVCFSKIDLKKRVEKIWEIAGKVQHTLKDFTGFLMAKAFRNYTLRSRALLSINKYLEEFPGLVHFLYIDRTDHRLTAPSLDFSSEETNNLTKIKIWEMIEFGRRHLEDGHLAFMWKDTTFNYAYYLWFEDNQGSAIKPKICPANVIKNLPVPGILGEDFYRHLVEACFPKVNAQKIHCFELYCIHLGLATSSCVLDQSRRIAATVHEVTGNPKHSSDLS